MNSIYPLGLVFGLVIFSESFAQKPRPAIRREIHAMRQARKELLPVSLIFRGSSTQFWGELHHYNLNWSYGAGLQFNLKDAEAFSLGMDLSKGRLSGRKATFFNSRFISDFTSVEFVSRWDLIRALYRDSEEKFSVNIYTGIGLSFFSANAYHLKTGEIVRRTNYPQNSRRNPLFRKYGPPKGSKGVRKTHERIVPVGFALGYRFAKEISMGLDVRYHFARTDKLDATSGRRLINPEEADSYSRTPNDAYSSIALLLNYRLLKKRR